jgi:PAS domain S-box-containing protein
MDKINETRQTSMQQIIDKLPAVVFEYTVFPDGSRDFTYVSARCQEILGLSQEIILSGIFPMRRFIHPDDWESFFQSSEKSIAAVTEWKWQGRMLQEDRVVWVESLSTPTRLEDGRVAWSGFILDITGRKNLEQRQGDAERSYRDLLEQIPLGIGIHKKGKLVYVNGYALKMMAASRPEDMTGKNVIDFVHPQFLEVAKARVKQALAGQPTQVMEEQFVRLDGKVITVEASSHPFTYEGEPAVQVIVKDITDQKRAEQISRKAETLFSQLFQKSPFAIVMLNEKGTVVEVNKGFEEMFGFTGSELQGKELNQFIVPGALESEGNDLNSLITSEKVIRIETHRIRQDRTPLSVIIYGVPVHLDDTTIGIFGVYVDITEQKKIEEELKVRNTELDNFVYKVSHDLRAPLSSVLGLVNLASLAGNNDNLKDYLPLIGEKVQQLDHFISDVLSHSKNLKLEVKARKIDFTNVVRQTFKDLGYLDGTSGIRKEIAIEGVDFFSDPWRIAEIFRNLVSNAIKYRDLHHPAPSIHIYIRQTKHTAEIIFKDNGIGIAPADLQKIFDMFYRASEQSQGSGLGLYIVKNAVDKLGGDVVVESARGLGTTFTITLPNLAPSPENS